jgi:hypothetical protein
MRALAAEAKKQGLKFCFYYSILDLQTLDQHKNECAPRMGREDLSCRALILAST